MSHRIELSTRTVVWTFIAASDVAAYLLTMSTDMPGIVRYVSGWYTLIVGSLLFTAVAITLSVVFREHGRLDTPYGWVLRAFLFL